MSPANYRNNNLLKISRESEDRDNEIKTWGTDEY
jgi:hypothetical protein